MERRSGGRGETPGGEIRRESIDRSAFAQWRNLVTRATQMRLDEWLSKREDTNLGEGRGIWGGEGLVGVPAAEAKVAAQADSESEKGRPER